MAEETGQELTDAGTIPEMKYPPAGYISFQILTEYRNRKQGGRLFHITLNKPVLTQKEAVALANQILIVSKEK